MSVICQTFVQNTWRSDLCSNCFKSLADHTDSGGRTTCDRLSTPRYVPQAASLYQSRGISTSLKWRLSESVYERVSRRDFGSQTKMNQQQETCIDGGNRGILVLNAAEKKTRSRSSVDFASEEALVIGYGGNDYDSDHSPWEMGSDDESIDLDLLNDTDEDRKISKLTKNNTEFNSSNKNLLTIDESSNQAKKEEEKLNSINNNANNPVKNTDKALNILGCVTYNDIQSDKPEKKLNQYYFPSSTEALKSYLHGNSNIILIEDSLTKNNNERSGLSDNLKTECSTKEVTKCNGSNILLNDDFSPLNTRTYSFVSELNKNTTSAEQSSDSDYSTCRHTAGDSTDSESFHDAEERIAPCNSFLHGTFPPRIPEPQLDKKYDAGSSTSGDVSNFSDDSDTHEPNERSYKARTVRSSKSSPTNDCARLVPQKELDSKNSNDVPTQQKSSVKDVNSSLVTAQKNRSATAVQVNRSESIPSNHAKNRVYQQITIQKENLTRSLNPQTDSKSQNDCAIKSPEQAFNAAVSVHQNARHLTPNSGLCENKVCKLAEPEMDVIEENIQKYNDKESKERIYDAQNCENYNFQNCDQNLDSGFRSSDESRQEYDETADYNKSPDVIVDRQSKLAALALELELARRNSASKSAKANSPPELPSAPPEVKTRCSPQASSTPASSSENYPTIKKNTTITSRMSSLPDVLQETPTKQKKNKFSLKKLLKRSKDSANFSLTSKDLNPKAWKKQTFDRSRLSLEIVHPMDMTSDPPTSTESTPTEEHRQIVSTHPRRLVFKSSSRARSLSALPQLSNEFSDDSGCALLECRKMDTVPARKAGTVAERKKNRPSLVRTPSCSALPNRPMVVSPPPNTEKAPPPKPPPPPKGKVTQPPPPPPPHVIRAPKSSPPLVTPARPPPPKIPELKARSTPSGDSSKQESVEQHKGDKEYANLGDIRSLLTPKKPQRPSAVSAVRENEMDPKRSPERIYETLQVTEEEEDHYTYLDDAELQTSKKREVGEKETTERFKTSGETLPSGRPWLDLQTSYEAIAAANYESLAELITTSLTEGIEYFQKAGRSFRWNDFVMEDEEPTQIIRERFIYNGFCKNESQDKITLMVASRKQVSTPGTRAHTRYPVLASFYESIPKRIPGKEHSAPYDTEMASIYVMQRANITTVSKFVKTTSTDKSNQHIHLRNYCFVLLQLIHTLKSLQAEGIEEINYDLERLILVVTNEEKPPILVLFPEDKIFLTLCDSAHNRKTLCQATLETLYHFLQLGETDDLKTCVVNGELLTDPVADTFRAIATVLFQEKASSLSQAKGFLEYMLWGPVDVKIPQEDDDGVVDIILQRWLDLQRAQMVKSTISLLQLKKNSYTGLHVYEEYQLIFLLQASVKSLKNVISKL